MSLSVANDRTARVDVPVSVGGISVVIAWVNGLELLQPGMDALQQQSRAADEIIVVTRHDAESQKRFQSLYPEVVLISAPANTTITILRSMGIKRASGSIIVVTEDHCVPALNWIATIERRMQGGCSVVGGPVENAPGHRVRDWAAFLMEYAGAIGPAVDGPVGGLPGNNVAYKRELVSGLCDVLESDRWESFYHSQLVERGVVLTSEPSMIVYHKRPFDFWYFISQRFHFCRSFAGMRRQSFSMGQRLKYGFGSVLLPPLLWLRGLRTLMAKKRYVGLYLFCSPMIAVYLIAGAWGEMVGYFFGGGYSLEHIE